MADDKNFVAMVAGESEEQTQELNTSGVREDIISAADDSKNDDAALEAAMAAPHKVDRGSDEYLQTHPRVGAVVAALVCAGLLFVGFAVVFYLGVWTLDGQRLDYWMFMRMNTIFPSLKHPALAIFIDSHLIIAICVAMIVMSFIISLLRKRFYTSSIIAVFIVVSFATSFVLKRLPHVRPVLDSLIPDPTNSAPSGHTALTVIAGMALVMAVPRALRAVAAAWGACFTAMVGVMVVNFKWHRPTDVYTAILWVAALALIAMSVTRKSGLDKPGTRKSSASVQIVSTVFTVLGLSGIAYGAYVIMQVRGLIQYQPDDFTAPVGYATVLSIFAFSLLVYGVALAIRQVTASPLTRSGLIGAPPMPPQKG